MKWFGARTLYRLERAGEDQRCLLEHRVVIFQASSEDDAIEKAENEALEHARSLSWEASDAVAVSGQYLEVCDVFRLSSAPADGIEVYSSHVLHRGRVTSAELVDLQFGPERDDAVQGEMDEFVP